MTPLQPVADVLRFIGTAAILFGLFGLSLEILRRLIRQPAAPPPPCLCSQPGPQARAENDCFSCVWREACLSPAVLAEMEESR